MNLNLSSLTGIVKKISYGERPHPWRDWLIIVIVTVVLVAVAAGWSHYLFVHISSGEIFGAPAQTGNDASESSLEAVRTTFEKRSIERTHYLTDYHFVDPSR